MRMKLPSGRQVRIGVVYWTHEVPKKGTYRNVQVSIVEGYVLLGTGIAQCSPLDKFCKLTGRKAALKRAVTPNNNFTKEDRKALFLKLCGKLAKGSQ